MARHSLLPASSSGASISIANSTHKKLGMGTRGITGRKKERAREKSRPGERHVKRIAIATELQQLKFVLVAAKRCIRCPFNVRVTVELEIICHGNDF